MMNNISQYISIFLPQIFSQHAGGSETSTASKAPRYCFSVVSAGVLFLICLTLGCGTPSETASFTQRAVRLQEIEQGLEERAVAAPMPPLGASAERIPDTFWTLNEACTSYMNECEKNPLVQMSFRNIFARKSLEVVLQEIDFLIADFLSITQLLDKMEQDYGNFRECARTTRDQRLRLSRIVGCAVFSVQSLEQEHKRYLHKMAEVDRLLEKTDKAIKEAEECLRTF
ncbi:MAG: hypothetical protein Q4D38_14515 [Planctomycetia bacterium]|nr:hypothetical protein [Planctomycetia bacterium]